MFRIAAVLLGLSVFPIAEGVCHVFDWGRPDEIDDPFVGFSDMHPLFVKNPEEQRFEIARSRLLFFKPDSFPAKKSADTFRIFCLGGSTVQGRPWSIETSFTNWLKIGLAQFDPSRKFEVVNCGGISYASYRLVPILKECLTHEPDMIIICTGHNEFIEDRQYGEMKSPNRLTGLWQSTTRLRSLAVIRSSLFGNYRSNNPPSTILNSEVDAILDYQDGLKHYHRDDQWQAGVIRHFETNLRRMLTVAKAAKVPVVLMQPCNNLKDSPPFKSEHSKQLSNDQRLDFNRLVQQGRENLKLDLQRSIKSFEKAIELDPLHALTLFELGKCYESAHRIEDARRMFVAAKENDICPLRMIEPLANSMQLVADEMGIDIVNVDELMSARSKLGITGRDMLVDHIHPSFRSHQIIAEELIQLLAARLKFDLPDDWREKALIAFRFHLGQLDDLYFLKGQRSLEALTLWTQGKADGPPLSTQESPQQKTGGRN